MSVGKIVSLAAWILMFHVVTAIGQDLPRGELFLAPSFSRQGARNLYGWHAAFNTNVTSWAGITFDLSGHYSSDSGSFASNVFSSVLGVYSVRAGPRFSFVRSGAFTVFAHGLIGGTFLHETTYFNGQSGTSRLSGFSAAPGLGIDVSLNDNASWRVFEADYSFFRILGEPSQGIRVSTGIVVKFD